MSASSTWSTDPRRFDAAGKDVYFATLGNNPVFVESTADLGACADEVVLGKSYCYGMLPGAEQSAVVERAVDTRFQEELRRRGCHFLSDEEADRLVALHARRPPLPRAHRLERLRPRPSG